MRIIFRQQGEIFTVEITNFFFATYVCIVAFRRTYFPGFLLSPSVTRNSKTIQLIEFSVSVLKKNRRYSDPKLTELEHRDAVRFSNPDRQEVMGRTKSAP